MDFKLEFVGPIVAWDFSSLGLQRELERSIERVEGSRTSGFTVLVTEQEGVPLVAASGEIDLHAAPKLRSALQDAWSKTTPDNPTVLVDLSEVGFMDSSGLGVLIGHHRELEELGGGLRIVAGEAAMKILRITHLDTVFGIYETRKDAVSGSAENLG